MRELLEFAGVLLYIACSIVIFPIVVITQCLLEACQALSYIRSHRKEWKKRWKNRPAYKLPRYVGLALARIRSMHL